jgi:hypothetical protein
MKQKFTLLLLFASVLAVLGPSSVFSQSLQLVNPITMASGIAGNDLIEVSFGVKNISNSSKNVKVEREVIFEVPGSENNICWGVACYPPFVGDTPSPENIASGQTNNTFKGDYKPNGNVGHTRVKYCFYVDGNKQDSTCVVINYYGYRLENSGFENWVTQAGITEPDGWVTSNKLVQLGATTQTSVFETQDAQTGSAARIVTVKLDNNPFPQQLSDTLGFIALGSLTTTGELRGQPFQGMPSSIEFYSKYQPQGQDTFSVAVYLTRWNTATTSSQVIAEGTYRSHATENSYSLKGVNLAYNTFAISDSILIVVNSSGRILPKLGSELFVDEFFAGDPIVSVPRIALPIASTKAFPNPARDFISIVSQERINSVVVYDLNGKLIHEESLHQYNNQLNFQVSHLKAGIYFYQLKGENTVSSGKFTVIK